MGKRTIAVIIGAIVIYSIGIFMVGYGLHQPQEVVKIIETRVTQYQPFPPYEAFPDPIDFDQALYLLHGMRQSHIETLKWKFKSDPGFGIADREVQKLFIKEYDQLIDIFWRMRLEEEKRR